MGVRGELFSTKVALQNRTYFFNVKENRLGDLYLNIVESKNRETGGFDRQSVILFADDLKEFLTGFDESLRVMEKAVREKRRVDKPRGEDSRDRRRVGEGPKDRQRSGRKAGDGPPSKPGRKTGEGPRRTKPDGNRPPEKTRKRVVVRRDKN